MKYLLLPLLAVFLGGCASLPPEVVTQSTALKAFHKKSSAGSLAVYDASLDTLKYTLTSWKNLNASRTGEYVAACKETSEVFAATRNTLREIADLLAQLPTADVTRQGEIRAQVDQKFKALHDELATRTTSFDAAARDAQARNTSDAARFDEQLRKLELGDAKLRALIVESADTVTEGLAKQEAVLTSYLLAHSKMKEVFGAQLTAEATTLSQEASQLAGKYAPYISTVESLLK